MRKKKHERIVVNTRLRRTYSNQFVELFSVFLKRREKEEAGFIYASSKKDLELKTIRMCFFFF